VFTSSSTRHKTCFVPHVSRMAVRHETFPLTF